MSVKLGAENFAFAALTTSDCVSTPCLTGGFLPIPFRTVKAQKDWCLGRIGKHVQVVCLCSLYNFIISSGLFGDRPYTSLNLLHVAEGRLKR